MFSTPSYEKNIWFRIRGFSKNYILHLHIINFSIGLAFNFYIRKNVYCCCCCTLFFFLCCKIFLKFVDGCVQILFYLFTDALIFLSAVHYNKEKYLYTSCLFYFCVLTLFGSSLPSFMIRITR